MAMAVGNHYTAREVTTHPIPALMIGPNHNNHTTRPSESVRVPGGFSAFYGSSNEYQDILPTQRTCFVAQFLPYSGKADSEISNRILNSLATLRSGKILRIMYAGLFNRSTGMLVR